MRVKIHLFSVCPFGLHGVLRAERIEVTTGQKEYRNRVGRRYRKSDLEENAQDQALQKTQRTDISKKTDRVRTLNANPKP